MHFVVYNPMAGRGRARRALAVAEAYLVEHAMPYRVLTTTRRGHASELVDELPRDAAILVIGGDGTTHEVARACVGGDRTLGVIPSGSGDDFAFALGIDRHDPRTALDRIRLGRVRTVDVGTANGEPFVNALGAGFDADVAAHVEDAPPIFHGLAAYLYALVMALKDFRLAEARVEVDGALVHDGPALLVSAQNGPRTGGSFLIAPEAEPDDGLLDILVAGRFTRAGALAILPRLMRGAHLDHPEVLAVRGARASVTWSAPRTFHMEGEVFMPRDAFDIGVRPGALRVWS